ncbi:MAG: hypothetical protein ABIA78_02110 [archaeon]
MVGKFRLSDEVLEQFGGGMFLIKDLMKDLKSKDWIVLMSTVLN